MSFAIRAGLVAGLMMLVGCSGLEQLSSGHVGCAPNEITVSQQDTTLVGRTWTAECRGQVYFCSTNGGGDGASSVVACTPAAGPPGGAGAAPEPPPEPQAAPVDDAGCSYDTQCKGDRICEEGICTAPPVSEPARSSASPEPAAATPAAEAAAPEPKG